MHAFHGQLGHCPTSRVRDIMSSTHGFYRLGPRDKARASQHAGLGGQPLSCPDFALRVWSSPIVDAVISTSVEPCLEIARSPCVATSSVFIIPIY